MAKKYHYPPSVYRYRKSHPTVGCTLTVEQKKVLDRCRGKLSYGAFIKKFLTEKVAPCDQGYQEGYKEGYEKAKKEYCIRYNCAVCGKPITILSDSNEHEDLIKLLK